MREQGLITKLDGEFATVKVDKKDECSKCGMCLFPQNASSIEIRAKNPIGAIEGDTVIFEREKETKLLGSILVFLIPLLLIGISSLITYLFIKIEIWMLILSVIFIVLWYTILAFIDKKMKILLEDKTSIISVVDKENIWAKAF